LAFNRLKTLAKVLNERREAIARRWIERVRGHLEPPGQGCIFAVTLP